MGNKTDKKFEDKVFLPRKFEQKRVSLMQLADELRLLVNDCMTRNIPIDAIRSFNGEESKLKDWFNEAKNEYIASFKMLPPAERNRIATQYANHYDDCHISVIALSALLARTDIVFRDGADGWPVLDFDASCELARTECWQPVDADTLARLHEAYAKLVGAISAFGDEVHAILPDVDLNKPGGVMLSNKSSLVPTTIDMRGLLAQIAEGLPNIDTEADTRAIFWSYIVKNG